MKNRVMNIQKKPANERQALNIPKILGNEEQALNIQKKSSNDRNAIKLLPNIFINEQILLLIVAPYIVYSLKYYLLTWFSFLFID